MDKAKEYRDRSRAKRGKEYWREAVARSRAKNPDRARELSRLHRAARRARLAGARTEKYIQLKKLHNWESRICGICLLSIEADYHIDHIIPLHGGGAHETTNLQLTHPFCNQSKFTKLPSEISGVTITA